MNIKTIKILGMLTVPVGYYDTVADVDKAAGKVGECLRLANVYMGQKGSLVEARSWLTDLVVEKSGFARKTKTEPTKDKAGTVTGTKTVDDETEGEYLKRFVAATHKVRAFKVGEVEIPTATLSDPKAATGWLQSLINAHGPFNNDAAHPERTGKAKTPPDYALKAARQVLNPAKSAEDLAKAHAHWTAEFTKRGISFQPFNTADHEANVTAFAWAANEREEQRKAEKMGQEYK